MEIKNKEDWWRGVDDHWENLLDIIFHHMDCRHAAYEIPGDAKSKPTGRNILDEVEYLRKNRNEKLARYFSTTWCLASDAYAWTVPSWGVLCDLCSEEYVLDDCEI